MFKDTVLVQSQIPSTQMKFFAIMRNNQSEVDNIYGELITVYSKQMDLFLGPFSDTKSKVKHKPNSWWTPELSDLWKTAKESEKLFFKAKKRNENKAQLVI